MTAEEILRCVQVGLKCIQSVEGVVREAVRDEGTPRAPAARAPTSESPHDAPRGPASQGDDLRPELLAALLAAANRSKRPESDVPRRASSRPRRSRPVVCALCEMPRGPHRVLIARGRGAVCEHCLAHCAEAQLRHRGRNELSLEHTILLTAVCSMAMVRVRLTEDHDLEEAHRAHQRLANLFLGGAEPTDGDEGARILTLDS